MDLFDIIYTIKGGSSTNTSSIDDFYASMARSLFEEDVGSTTKSPPSAEPPTVSTRTRSLGTFNGLLVLSFEC